MVGSYFVLSSASMATCLSPSPFPYTVFTSAAQFSSSGKYGLDDKGILTFDYGRAYGGLGRWHNPFLLPGTHMRCTGIGKKPYARMTP